MSETVQHTNNNKNKKVCARRASAKRREYMKDGTKNRKNMAANRPHICTPFGVLQTRDRNKKTSARKSVLWVVLLRWRGAVCVLSSAIHSLQLWIISCHRYALSAHKNPLSASPRALNGNSTQKLTVAATASRLNGSCILCLRSGPQGE